jgi:hypothetical protein
MVDINSKVDECPFCHSNQIKNVPNEKTNDLFYCEACNHRFRYDPMCNFTTKCNKEKDKEKEGEEDE